MGIMRVNMYYIKSITDIINSIDVNKGDIGMGYSGNIDEEEIMDSFVRIEVDRLVEIVTRLPNKTGTEEGISSNIMKTALPAIKVEFARVINSSLTEGQCPEGWKISTVILIPKVTNPKKASEYRSTNILPVYEKVLELVVKEQIESYLENKGIITEHQFGFRKHHSCETALQIIIDE